MSRDGGLTWLEIAKGKYVYDIMNHGGLIIISRSKPIDKEYTILMYSWNQGETWENIIINGTNAIIEDIYVEPNSVTQNLMIHLICALLS